MANCVYPQCKKTANSKEREDWCTDHEATVCSYPPCEALPLAGSGFCQEDNDWFTRFDWIQGIRHEQARQQAQAQQRYQQLLANMGNGKGDPKDLMRGR